METPFTNNDYLKGRGAQLNTPNKYEALTGAIEHWEGIDEVVNEDPGTEYIVVHPKEIVNKITSPDLPMPYSLNPYQGCEHGCIYCYARNSHEYWGYSAGLDFESRILVKEKAPELLRKTFMKKSWQPAMVSVSGNTDCYQPAERRFGITRRLLEVFLEFGNPVGMITKNALVLRDLDLLKQLAEKRLVQVFISITSLDETVRRALEPGTVTAKAKLNTIKTLSENGIPVGVMTAPVIPGLNDHEIPALIEAAAAHGARRAGYTIVRLNGASGLLFEDWIGKAFPSKAEKVLNQVKQCHNGTLNDNRWGTRMAGEGPIAEAIRQMHRISCKKHFSSATWPEINLQAFKRPGQLELF